MATKKKNSALINPHTVGPALGKTNFIILAISAAIVIFGFVLMTGGASPSPDKFSYAIFSFRRIVLAPILIIFGFALAIYGILKTNKQS
jgi:uncharacterized membrane protein YidH (DUF202 family)